MPNCSDSPLLPSPKEVAGWESAQQRCEQIQEGLGTSPKEIFAVDGAISGYDLVTRVLDHPDGGVEALIDLAGGAETDWLEFKAAMIGRHQDRKNPNEKDSDGHWNVAEAVLAMANTCGGAVLVGIDDDGKTVGLQSGDPRKVIEEKGLEAFRRIEIKDKIHPTSGSCKWETGVKGIWELEQPWPPDQFCVRGATHKGQDIAIILVRPVPAKGNCLIVLHNGEERLLRRAPGHVGQVEPLRGRRAIEAVEGSRSTESPELSALWERFRRQVEEQATGDEELEAAISAWHVKYRKEAADLLVTFTPLDAEENSVVDETFEVPVPRDLFEPHATENLPDYLRDDFYDDMESEEGPDDAEDDDDYSTDRPMRRGGLFKLLATEPRAAVLGEPGGGKTTCLRRLALDAVTDYQLGGQVTLYVPLARWQAAGGLWSLIRRRTGLSPGQVERLIAAGRCCLLLDALNECPDALRPTAVNAVTDLLREYPKVPVVISARTSETTAPFRLPTFTVEPLTGEQRKAFLHAYLGDSERADQLLERIGSQPGGENLASNPLLLRMVVEVVLQEGDLPAGRAGLYRQWIAQWHARESDKARKAGDPLPWGLDETRRGFAAIAFASRREGLRIADDDLVLESLAGVVTDSAKFLERMTNGPLLIREDGCLEFRHETFQEYLCAEALLADPRALSNAGPDDYSNWGMALAYAAEIADCLPNDLMSATWRVSPWLAAALSRSGDPIPEVDPSLKPLIEWFLHEKKPGNVIECLYAAQWYGADGPMQYTVNRLGVIQDRWYQFEISQLQVAWHPSMAGKVLRRAITLTPDQKGFPNTDYRLPVRSWLKRIKPSNAILIKILANAGFITNDDLTNFRQIWLRKATPIQAAELVTAGICSKQDFEYRKVAWIAAATPREAAALTKCGICLANNFHGHMENWILRSTPTEAFALLEAGILTMPDLAIRRPAWIAHSQPKEAAQLVKKRILAADDFAERRQGWLQSGSLKSAVRLVSAGILNAVDFASKAPKWIQKANPKEAAALVKAGICNVTDFESRMAEWKTNATPKQTALLSKAGFGDTLVFVSTINDLMPDSAQSDQIQIVVDQSVSEWIAPDPNRLDEKKLLRETAHYLRNRNFQGSLCHIHSEYLFGFIECRAFPYNVFCHRSVWPTKSAEMTLKSNVEFQVTIQENKKKGVWGYVARNVKIVSGSRNDSQESDGIRKEVTMGTVKDLPHKSL